MVPHKNNDTFQLEIDVSNIFTDCVGDSVKNEFEDAMRKFQYLTDKAKSFSLPADNDDIHGSSSDENETDFEPYNSSQYKPEEIVDDTLSVQVEDVVISPESPKNNFNDTPKKPVASIITENNEQTVSKAMDDSRKRKAGSLEADNSANEISKKSCPTQTPKNATLNTTDAITHNADSSETNTTGIGNVVNIISKVDNVEKRLPFPAFGYLTYDDTKDDAETFRMRVIDGLSVELFIDRFEEFLNECNLNFDKNWYQTFELCMKKHISLTKVKLYPWYEECLHEALSWSTAKAMIREKFGFKNRKNHISILWIIGNTQQLDQSQSFKDYFDAYSLAARSYRYVDNTLFPVHPDNRNSDYLIENFISGTYHKEVSAALKVIWQVLTLPGRTAETSDLPKEEYLVDGWIEFEEKVREQMDTLLSMEQEGKQKLEEQKQAEERKKQEKLLQLQRRELRSQSWRQAKRETRIAMSRLNPNLISPRKELGLCVYCGVVKHSYAHTLVCPEKKRLVQES